MADVEVRYFHGSTASLGLPGTVAVERVSPGCNYPGQAPFEQWGAPVTVLKTVR